MNVIRIRWRAIERRRSRRRPSRTTFFVLSVVDTRTETLHRVPVDVAAQCRSTGRCPALCGEEVPAASLTTPASTSCFECASRAERVGR